MSILQEYEQIKSRLRKGEFNGMERYLAIHSELLLSDLYYKEEEYKKFDAWWQKEQKSQQLFPEIKSIKPPHEDGVCPVCSSSNIEYGAADFEDNQMYYPVTCKHCGATFEAWYTLQFSGHENIEVEDKEGGKL